MTEAQKPKTGAVPRLFYTIDGVRYCVRTYCAARGLTDPTSVNRVRAYISTQRKNATQDTDLVELLEQRVTWTIRKLKNKQQQEANQELAETATSGDAGFCDKQLLQTFALEIIHALKPQLRAPMEGYAAALKERSRLCAEFIKTREYIKELETQHNRAKIHSDKLQTAYAKNREELEELEMLMRNVDKKDA